MVSGIDVLVVKYDGGMIHGSDNATIDITSSSFTGVGIVTGNKWGVIMVEDSHLTVEDTSFTRVYAAGGGGAIASKSGDVALKRVSFERTLGYDGGAIHSDDDEKLLLEDVSFLNSEAEKGGAVFTDMTRFVVVNQTTAETTSAAYDGGFLDVNKALYLIVEGSDFSGAAANMGKGGVIATNAYQVVIKDSNFSGSFANVSGGAVFTDQLSEAVSISNSNFFNCSTGLESPSWGLTPPGHNMTLPVGGGAVTVTVPATPASNYTVFVTGSTFKNNTSPGAGSALLVAFPDVGGDDYECSEEVGNKVLVAESKFASNVAVSGSNNTGSNRGGALSFHATGTHCGELTVYAAEFLQNTVEVRWSEVE